jgi:hypothetical protein
LDSAPAQKLPLQCLRSPGTFLLAALAQMRSGRLGLAAPQVTEGRPRRGEWRHAAAGRSCFSRFGHTRWLPWRLAYARASSAPNRKICRARGQLCGLGRSAQRRPIRAYLPRKGLSRASFFLLGNLNKLRVRNASVLHCPLVMLGSQQSPGRIVRDQVRHRLPLTHRPVANRGKQSKCRPKGRHSFETASQLL